MRSGGGGGVDLAVQELGKVLRASGSRGSKRGGAAEVYRGQGGRSFNSDAKSYRRRVLPAERRRGTAGMSGAASLVLSSGMGGAGGVWDAN